MRKKFEALLASEEAVRRLPFRERMKLHFTEGRSRRWCRTQRCSMPVFLTLAFLILSGSHAGPFAGLSTIAMLPVKQWTRLVPRSRRRMVVCPRVAAFRAAPRGCLLAKTWLVSFPFSMRTKYFLSDILDYLRYVCRLYSI